MYPKKNKEGQLIFPDHLEFIPNLSPKQVFQYGAFDGTYFRPIHSAITGKNYKNIHKKYTFLNSIPESKLCRPLEEADVSINKYKVHVGQTLEQWESNGWIKASHTAGWVHWFCDFYNGRRHPDDERQIKRWLGVAGPNGRFRKNLINQIHKSEKKYDDYSIAPKYRQILLHWNYELTKKDYEDGIKTIKK